MQTRPSRLLENLLALSAFDAEKNKYSTHLIDRLFLLVMAHENCHAMQILNSRLKEWELYQIKIRIEREIEKGGDTSEPVSLESFYTALIERLIEVSGKNTRPTTAHLLLLILSDRNSVAGQVLGLYHIKTEDVVRAIAMLPAEEAYMGEIRIVRREIRPEDDDWEPTQEPRKPASRNKKKETMLDKYGVELTRAAAEGRIDTVVGRQREIERLVQILGRRKKNNPILIGEAGVGKSAIVEGLALKIASGDAPASLAAKKIWSLDIASLVAGTKFRGEFEERIKALMDELTQQKDTIVFIDEIHTIVGAGSTQGSLDTANILKPALARGDMQCIGATTLDEYRETIEADAALERRFQKIIVEPTSREDTLEILRNIKPHYERHHSVVYTPEAIEACVALTERYITDRHFPDKAIDALDEAGSKARCFDKEGGDTAPRVITAENIEQVITTMTGIPVEKVSRDEGSRLGSLLPHLEEVVVGQPAAVEKVARSIVRSRSGLKDPAKPIGVFLFVGPTGVGKTLLAKELSKWMFDRPDALIRIDMSEFAEKHNVSRLIGSPPGYVGYGEGGQLTEAVRRQPYSVVLFDEVEKAHPDVFNVMLQMFDDGHLTDGLGRKVDFRNTIIIMTSNVGSREIAQKAPAVGYGTSTKPLIELARKEGDYRRALKNTFAPEFINRIDDIVVFNTLSSGDIERVVDLELRGLTERAEKLGYRLDISEAAKRELASLGYEPEYGVRSLKRTILEHVEEPLAQMIVAGEIRAGETVEIVHSGESLELLVKVAS
ncbi:MAG: ATP-dependent Clp protease ATP-binding subunit [Rikenellaceae bacterium]|jgi:ATP-dependent Clp protease ATP-binding subunit ClpC|nr:ATP-dependent Clp protease ATP-binding subunit [Rikenellaceae bacterium]